MGSRRAARALDNTDAAPGVCPAGRCNEIPDYCGFAGPCYCDVCLLLVLQLSTETVG